MANGMAVTDNRMVISAPCSSRGTRRRSTRRATLRTLRRFSCRDFPDRHIGEKVAPLIREQAAPTLRLVPQTISPQNGGNAPVLPRLENRGIQRPNECLILRPREDHVVTGRDGWSKPTQLLEPRFIKRHDRQVLERRVHTVDGQLHRPHGSRAGFENHGLDHIGIRFPQMDLGGGSAQNSDAEFAIGRRTQILESRKTGIVPPSHHLQLVHAGRVRVRDTGGVVIAETDLSLPAERYPESPPLENTFPVHARDRRS